MLKTPFMIAALMLAVWQPAFAPPIGPAQRHAAMQQAAPFARRYKIRVPLAESILRAAQRAEVPVAIAFRLVKAESNFDSLAVSPTGALGLTQVLPSTGKYWCPRNDLLRVDTNLECGFTYLKSMYRRYQDWYIAAAAYNLGPAVADTSRSLQYLRYSQVVVGPY